MLGLFRRHRGEGEAAAAEEQENEEGEEARYRTRLSLSLSLCEQGSVYKRRVEPGMIVGPMSRSFRGERPLPRVVAEARDYPCGSE